MNKTFCDRCNTQIVNSFSIYKVCFHHIRNEDNPTYTKDLCNTCYNKWQDLNKEFFENDKGTSGT